MNNGHEYFLVGYFIHSCKQFYVRICGTFDSPKPQKCRKREVYSVEVVDLHKYGRGCETNSFKQNCWLHSCYTYHYFEFDRNALAEKHKKESLL